jgi:hypothetical protein
MKTGFTYSPNTVQTSRLRTLLSTWSYIVDVLRHIIKMYLYCGCTSTHHKERLGETGPQYPVPGPCHRPSTPPPPQKK